MEIKICWLYYDLLELYGDRGNIKVLTTILDNNNILYTLDKVTINDDRDISNYDFYFLGGGSDKAQQLLYKDLLSRKSQILEAFKRNAFFLTVCGGYQMFGKYYIDSHGNKIDGLGIFDFYSEGGSDRCIGNVVCKAKLGKYDIDLVGFENHGGKTLNVLNPFARVVKGNGNEFNSEFEGFYLENFLGTYLHGPLLPKNPEVGKFIIEYIILNKYKKEIDIDIDFIKYYKNAKNVILKREL